MKKILYEVFSTASNQSQWIKDITHTESKLINEVKTKNLLENWYNKTVKELFDKTKKPNASPHQKEHTTTTEQENIVAQWPNINHNLWLLAENKIILQAELYQKALKIINDHTKNNQGLPNHFIKSLQQQLPPACMTEKNHRHVFNHVKKNTQAPENKTLPTRPQKASDCLKNRPTIDIPTQITNTPLHRQLFKLRKQNIANTPQEKTLSPAKDDNKIQEILEILTKHTPQIILQGPPGTGKTHTAKAIAQQLIGTNNLQQQCKIIQFHPAYTYEDFIRGISAYSQNGQITYKVKNKILTDFAQKAHQNYLDSNTPPPAKTAEQHLEEQFNSFIKQLTAKLKDHNSEALKLTRNVQILAIEEDAFRYGGKNWKQGAPRHRMKFSDIKQAYLDNNQTRQEIKNNKNLNGLASQHPCYYLAVLNKLKQFIKDNTHTYNSAPTKRKNFVLIIDEINRANLPLVLGELMYALEYRGEQIDSMYAIDNDSSLTLPPNLYIIGTMNTADRSVEAMDYSIRRRFAFIDIHPKPLTTLKDKHFAETLFIKVANLFIKDAKKYFTQKITLPKETHTPEHSEYICEEFNPLDIMLGHSYFIYDQHQPIEHRLKYQIKPLLKEYVKDGLLKESALNQISELTC